MPHRPPTEAATGRKQPQPRFPVPSPVPSGGKVMPTLVFQGAMISSEHTSQFLLPGSVGLRCSPPLRGSLKQLVPGYRTSCSDDTRGQSRETGSLSRPFGSTETTTKCVTMGPADCRARLQNQVQFSTAVIQWGYSHSGGPRAGSGKGTRSRHSLEEGGHRGGPSQRKGVRVLQPVIHSSKQGWGGCVRF